jgi:hypothetical protein
MKAMLTQFSNIYLSYPNGGYTTRGSENQYYADGRLRYARDLQDGNFDRAFSYDHAGRLKEAYTGREARGLSPNNPADSPFRQSYTYDSWNNLSRTGRHWTAPVSDTPTYTNNRRADWTYDANGSVTSRDSGQRTHAYDAAGQQRNFYEEGVQPFSGGSWVSHQYTINQTYDAAGRAGKRSETRHSEDENGTLEDSAATTYQLRSTVLGGALIIEIDQGGDRRGHVYAGGELIADYQYYPAPYTATSIYHRNPTTGQWVKNAVRTELDPLGADVSHVNPYLYNLTYSDIMGADNLYYQRGNALDIRGGCSLNGMSIPCSLANEAIAAETGSVAFEYRLNDGTVVGKQGTIRNVGAGLFLFDHPTMELDNDPVNDGRPAWRTRSFYLLPPQSAMGTARQKNCATPNSLVEHFKKDLESLWQKTVASSRPGVEGEEHGSLIFYEAATNTYPYVELSPGKHLVLGRSQYAPRDPAMPEAGADTANAERNFRNANRKVELLAFFHTHTNFPGIPSESRSGEPTSSDTEYQRNHGNALGIIRTGKGYSFFSNGKSFGPGDQQANECISNLKRARD